jgi:hypothetical protein
LGGDRRPKLKRIGTMTIAELRAAVAGGTRIYTIQTLWQSLRGGLDVTDDVMAILEAEFADRQLEPLPAG